MVALSGKIKVNRYCTLVLNLNRDTLRTSLKR